MEGEKRGISGTWLVVALVAVALLLTVLRFALVPRTNPKEADPGNPFYSPTADAPK